MPSNISYTIRSDGPHVLRCSVERPAAWWAGPALALAAALPGLALLAPAYASAAVTAALLLGAAAALAGAPCREEVEVVDGLGVLLTSGTTPGHYSCNAGTSTSTSTSGDDGSDGSGGSGGSSSGRGLHAWLAPPLLAALRPLGLHPGGGRQQRFLELEAVRDVALVEVMTSCDVAFHLVLERADGRGLVQAFPGVRPPLAVLRPMFRALAPRL